VVGNAHSTEGPETSVKVAIVHDYLTQRGGAERVVLSLTRAFPGAPIYTSLYDPAGTFPDFAHLDVRPMSLNRIVPLRKYHRAALPLLAPSFSRLHISADVVVCSSSGWAHGTHVEGRKIVYCHTPARWLYQSDRYLRGRSRPIRVAANALKLPLRRWDQRAAATADLYLANSTIVADRIASVYGTSAEVVPPPPAITSNGPMRAPDAIEPGFVLTVSRLLPYKNVDAVVSAFAHLPDERLVVAGAGPDEHELRTMATANVEFTGMVEDEVLRWLYANCRLLVAASHEDFGLTPLEAADFGKPTVALRFGGYLDTVIEGETGLFFDEPVKEGIADAVSRAKSANWNGPAIVSSARRFAEPAFISRVTRLAQTG
jgi:glycosyltransferase involved in cell wall biosynthesis